MSIGQNSGPVPRTSGEVFRAFLKLGLTSFGGPIAHLGYFRDEFVTRRQWLGEREYADLVALAQFLPGPASSQVGFALGLARAGPVGALAAFAAFTVPSALLMIGFAYGAVALSGPLGEGLIAGLKIVAVAIVAQAVWGMARTLCPDRQRASIAVAAVIAVIVVSGPVGQIGAILGGALAGYLLGGPDQEAVTGRITFPVSRRAGTICLAAFALLLGGMPLLAAASSAPGLAIFDAFYRAGALVFGGGHVVLPLLRAEVIQPGWIDAEAFLTGYGAAQALPGPLFAFAGYLGATLEPAPGGPIGAMIALMAIFLPGFLLLLGVLPFWDGLRRHTAAQTMMRGTNAAVVGILGAALYDPVFTSAVDTGHDFALALVCLVALTQWTTPPFVVVILGAVGGSVLGFV